MTAYERYKAIAEAALKKGADAEAIIAELAEEKKDIVSKRDRKLAALQFNLSPYPSREARRSANECLTAIDRLIGELKRKELSNGNAVPS